MGKVEGLLPMPCADCERRAARRRKIAAASSYFVRHVMPWLSYVVLTLYTLRASGHG